MEKKSIYEQIESKCLLEAQKIIDEGKINAANIKNKIINEARIEADKIIKRANEYNMEKIKTSTTNFEQLAKQKLLQNKKELIDKVTILALEKLQNLDDDELFNFVVNKIKAEDLKGDELLKVSQQDYEKYKSIFSTGKMDSNFIILDKLNNAISNNFNLRLDNDYANINGGFLVISANYDLDFSFLAILSNIKDEYEVEIAKILFEGE